MKFMFIAASNMCLKLTIGIIFLTLSTPAYGVDENVVKEKKCLDGFNDVHIDFEWMGEQDQFYVPFWNKLYSYRIASQLLRRDSVRISELDLLNSCVIMKTGNIVSGFGVEEDFNITVDPTSLTFQAQWEKAQIGKFTFHLTDNQTFILGITCWEDGESSWAVLSTTPSIKPEVRALVLKKVTDLGFSEELAVEESYNHCLPTYEVPQQAQLLQPISHLNYIYALRQQQQSQYTWPFQYYF